jgi:hypothetical protein
VADVSYDIKSTTTDTVDVLGLNDIKADLKLELPQPFKTEGSNTIEVKPLEIKPLKADLGTHLAIDPLKTDSSLSVDLKPAVVDLCLTLNIGKLPNVCITQPYHHRIGFSLFGIEVWGFSFSGEQETVIQERHLQPKVSLGAAPSSAWLPPHRAPPTSREAGGLRVRLGP